MGYVISGTTKDGTYLEVRDYDTAEGSDPDYFLDTPPGIDPGGAWDDDASPSCSSSNGNKNILPWNRPGCHPVEKPSRGMLPNGEDLKILMQTTCLILEMNGTRLVMVFQTLTFMFKTL